MGSLVAPSEQEGIKRMQSGRDGASGPTMDGLRHYLLRSVRSLPSVSFLLASISLIFKCNDDDDDDGPLPFVLAQPSNWHFYH